MGWDEMDFYLTMPWIRSTSCLNGPVGSYKCVAVRRGTTLRAEDSRAAAWSQDRAVKTEGSRFPRSTNVSRLFHDGENVRLEAPPSPHHRGQVGDNRHILDLFFHKGKSASQVQGLNVPRILRTP